MTTFPFHISVAGIADVAAIVDIGNDAFMADVFFKKPEFHLRFTAERVVEMIDTPHSVFLVARKDESSDILGCIYLHWDVHYDSDNNPDRVRNSAQANVLLLDY
jgi:poly-gamma-glutamate capsule biosynthesis protein CapA/YwtB (metallophosphatase superfamily)